MTLPDGLEWAAPGLHPDDWCIRVTDGASMLCGRALDGADRRHGIWRATRDGVEHTDEPWAGAGQVPADAS